MAAAQESAEATAAKEKEAAEEAAVEEAKTEDAKGSKAASKTRGSATSKGYTVTGAAVVLATKDKAERYLYRGTEVPDGVFTDASIKHALSVGLIEKSK